MNVNSKIAALFAKGIVMSVCTVVDTKGSTPRKRGAKMIILPDGKYFGSIGGGNLELQVIKDAISCIQKKESKLFRHDLLHHHSMCCGGSVEIFIEYMGLRNKLFIFGAGHTGQALASFAANLDFEVYLIDERPEQFVNVLAEGINKMQVPFLSAANSIPFDESSYVAIMTYDHAIDRDILNCCLKKPFAYLGMIGSQRKTEMTKKMFETAGIVNHELQEKIDMPMGIDILAETPAEIAISILSKMIMTKNSIKV